MSRPVREEVTAVPIELQQERWELLQPDPDQVSALCRDL